MTSSHQHTTNACLHRLHDECESVVCNYCQTFCGCRCHHGVAKLSTPVSMSTSVERLTGLIRRVLELESVDCHSQRDVRNACREGLPFVDRRHGKAELWIPTERIRGGREYRVISAMMRGMGWTYERKNSAVNGGSMTDGKVKVGYYRKRQ